MLQEDTMSIEELMSKMQVSRVRILKDIESGKLQAMLVNGAMRIKVADALAYLESCRYHPSQERTS